MTERTGIVYTLTDPRNGMIRYVGATTSALPDRLSGHLSTAQRGRYPSRPNRSPVAVWIRDLLAAGMRPRIAPLREVPEASLLAAEREEIERHFDEGWPLTNVKDSPAAPHQFGYERQLQAAERRAARVADVDDALLAEATADINSLRAQIAFMARLYEQMGMWFTDEPDHTEGTIHRRLNEWNDEPIGSLDCPPLDQAALDAVADALVDLVKCGARHGLSFNSIVGQFGRELVRQRRRDLPVAVATVPPPTGASHAEPTTPARAR